MTRDLADYVDRFGHIGVDVEVRKPGTTAEGRSTGASGPPATVAGFLRDLADDVERAGESCPSPPPR